MPSDSDTELERGVGLSDSETDHSGGTSSQSALFNNSSLSVADLTIALQAMRRRHNLSNECVRDLLSLFSHSLPEDNCSPATLHKLNKIIPSLFTGFKIAMKNETAVLLSFDVQQQLQTVLKGKIFIFTLV